MKSTAIYATALAAAFAFVPAQHARAWDNYGHMLVAEIAYQQLEPSTRTRVGELLKLNPHYNEWVQGVSNAKKNEIAFLMASRWPDAIKGEHGYTNDTIAQSGPDAARNIGYSDKLQHRYWHYVDLPFSPDGTALEQPEVPNALTQIVLLRDAISSPSTSDDVKSYDVAWLIHLVGDVHQPLHATSRFTQSETNGDRGGNDVKVCTPSCGKTLHSYWDDVLGTSNKPETARRNAGSIAPADLTLANNTDVATWINESLETAKNMAYSDPPIGGDEGPFTLTTSYKTTAKDVAKQRAALAGARLAKLLNDALH